MERFQIQLVVCDIDDTLINKEEGLEEQMVHELKELRRRGVLFTLATGRMPHRAVRYAKEAGLIIPYVANNGSILCDGERIIWSKLLYAKILQEPVQKYMERYPEFTVIFSFKDRECPLVRTEWITKRLKKYSGYDQTLGNTDEVWNQAVYKIFVLDDTQSGIIGRLAEELEGFKEEINFFQYGEYSIEIVAAGCSKASGLKRLLEYLSIPLEHVMAIGDHTNDIDMIKMAGIGVAVANADQTLQVAADYITERKRAEGVREAIRKFVMV